MLYVLAAAVGAVVFGLVIRNNPKLAIKLNLIVEKLDKKVSKKAVTKSKVKK